MRQHAWGPENKYGERACTRPGCTVRDAQGGGWWQRKKGAHWRRVESEPIRPCNGEDAAPPAAPPFLVRLRTLITVFCSTRGPKAERELATALDALERSLPDVLASHHALKRIQNKGGHGAREWQDCHDCKALLDVAP